MTWKCPSCGFEQNDESNIVCVCGFRDIPDVTCQDSSVAQRVQKSAPLKFIDVLSISLTLIVYLQFFRSFFIHTREEAMMFQLMAKSFSLAPLTYIFSLTASILKRRKGYSNFGLTETTLLASLPLTGVFVLIHNPKWYGANIQTYLLFRAVEFFLPSIVAFVLVVWLGRHRVR